MLVFCKFTFVFWFILGVANLGKGLNIWFFRFARLSDTKNLNFGVA